jgi:predicted DCC family thiol-disulfide oxidoreductase YuxK
MSPAGRYPLPMVTIMFDGECGLCTRLLSFVEPRLEDRSAVEFVSLGSDEAAARLGDGYQRVLDIDSMVVIDGLDTYLRSDAALAVAGLMGTPWRWLRVLRVFPKGLRDRVYAEVARRRKWFGEADACPVHLARPHTSARSPEDVDHEA